MKPENFVRVIRTEIIDDLVENYANIFSNTKIEKCSDISMKKIIEFWQGSDDSTKEILKSLIRLGSQNSVANLLGVIDNVSFIGDFTESYQLVVNNENNEMIISGDLLDIFWEQEENEGNVNIKK